MRPKGIKLAAQISNDSLSFSFLLSVLALVFASVSVPTLLTDLRPGSSSASPPELPPPLSFSLLPSLSAARLHVCLLSEGFSLPAVL